MAVVFSNQAETTLDGNVLAGDGTIDVTDGSVFAAITGTEYYYCTMVDTSDNFEIVKVTSRATNTLTVTRAQDGTAAQGFTDLDKIQIRLTAVTLEEFRDNIATNVTDITALDVRVGVNETDLSGATAAGTVPAASGTRMWFYQAAAPTNWTIYTTVEDCLVAIKGGAQDYAANIGDGAEAGSWTPTGHTHAGPSHTHNVDNHTHTSAAHVHSMPTHVHTGPLHRHTIAHTHTYSGSVSVPVGSDKDEGSGANSCAEKDHTHTYSGTSSGSSATYSGYQGTGNTGATDPGDTESTTPGQSAPVGLTSNAAGDAATAAGGEDGTDRPLAAVGIICTKD